MSLDTAFGKSALAHESQLEAVCKGQNITFFNSGIWTLAEDTALAPDLKSFDQLKKASKMLEIGTLW